jgi:transposase-like protein
MTRKRRSFSPEFKQESASLVLDQGYTISQAGVSLGVGETAIRRWIDQLARSVTASPQRVLCCTDRLNLPSLF